MLKKVKTAYLAEKLKTQNLGGGGEGVEDAGIKR